MARPTESAVRGSLYNWLGYGNLDGKYWFVGREERVSLDDCEALEDWSDYFDVRAGFGLATDFRQTWEESFGRPLSSFGTTTWHYHTAFLLALHGVEVSGDHVKRVLVDDPQFGRPFSDHFSGEFFPCPTPSKDSIEPYDHIWDSVEDYHAEVAPGRMDAFANALEANSSVELIVTYAPAFADRLSERYPTTVVDGWDDLAMAPIILSELEVSPERHVSLLETPFLGHGRISYDAIEAVVQDLELHR